MKLVIVLLALGACVSSYPVEIVETEPGHFVELIPLRRIPRRVMDEPEVNSRDEPEMSGTHAHGYGHPYDYVDYGAYTGGYGAFGWYSDHPVGGGYH